MPFRTCVSFQSYYPPPPPPPPPPPQQKSLRASSDYNQLVRELAGLVSVDVAVFRRWWAGELPSESGLHWVVGWALLLHRTRMGGAEQTNASVGLRPGTMELCSARLLGCTLRVTARTPEWVQRRYEEWLRDTREFGSCHPAPPRSVQGLARLIGTSASLLRRRWRADVPLSCGPKRLLAWATLLWVLEERERDRHCGTILSRSGFSRRTLERSCRDLAGCTLVAAAREPDQARLRFREWITEVADFR